MEQLEMIYKVMAIVKSTYKRWLSVFIRCFFIFIPVWVLVSIFPEILSFVISPDQKSQLLLQISKKFPEALLNGIAGILCIMILLISFDILAEFQQKEISRGKKFK